MKGASKKFEIAQQIRREEANLTLENMQSIESIESGYAILTLEEVIQTFNVNEESALFCLQNKESSCEDDNISLRKNI